LQGRSTHRAIALDLGPQLAAFFQRYSFASARGFTQHSLTGVLTIKEILQRELGLKTVSRRWLPHVLSPTQKVAHVEASTEMLQILYESEENHLKKSQGVTSLGSNNPFGPQKCLHDR
jgi:hypothetical protein